MIIRIIVALFIIVGVAGIIVASVNMKKVELTAQESEQISGSCSNCHHRTDNLEDDNVHQIHLGANCVSCHIDDSKIESANNTRDKVAWAGIGISGITFVLLIINYFVARIRLRT